MAATATKKRPASKPVAKAAAVKAATPPAPVVWRLLSPHAQELNRWLRVVRAAASTDDARPLLTCVHFKADGEKLTLSATDSYRLHRIETPWKHAAGEALIPVRFFQRMPKITKHSTLTITIDGDRITGDVDGDTWSVALVKGDFVNVDKLLADYVQEDKVTEAQRAFNPTFLGDVFRAARVFGHSGNYPTIRITHLDPMKPCRFDVTGHPAHLTMILMPVRVP